MLDTPSGLLLLTAAGSNDIMQHIAESCRNRPVTHIGTDGRRLSSYDSTITLQAAPNDIRPAQDQYDAIEAEIDQLKEDVAFLRMEADQGRTEPKTEQELAIDRFLSTRSKKSVRNNGTAGGESAAIRLQRLHEAQQTQGAVPSRNEQTPQVPPSSVDFPVLAPSNSGSATATPNITKDLQRKLSYANVATNGMMEAIDHAFSPAGKRRSDSKASATTSNGQPSTSDKTGVSTVSRVQTGSTSATGDSHEARDEEHSVTITSTHDTYAAVAEAGSKAPKHDQSSENKNTMKQSPRFAQPTKSFARRTGETLRRDATSVSPKSPADGSPSRTIKTKDPNLATSKHLTQQQQKRKSLPGDWVTPTRPPWDGSTANVTAKPGNTLTAGLVSSTTSKSAPVSKTTQVKVSTAVVPEKESQHQSPPRKKASSYMAPTSVATQRTIATLGENKPKADRTQTKTAEPCVDITHPNQYNVLRQRSSTTLSDNSSVQFILDSPGHQFPIRPNQQSGHDEETRAPSQMHSTSPSTPKSPPALTLRASVPRSPTRGPKARSHVGSTTRSPPLLADLMATQSVSSLPVVANTTTKRRTSNSNVLTPIVARLESEGILNKASQKNGVIRAFLQNTYANGNALHAARESSPGTRDQSPKKSPESLMPIPPPESNPQSKGKVVPPHLRPRPREASTTSTASETAPRPQQSPDSTPSSNLPGGKYLGGIASQFGHVQDSGRKPSATQSLRATAKEFKPGQSGNEDRIPLNRRWSTHWVSDAEWLMLPRESRNEIIQERERLRGARWLFDGLPSQRLPVYPASNLMTNAALNNLIVQRGMNTAMMNFVDENGSPNAIPIDQLLKPNIVPRKKTVQWVLQDCDGKETPVKFGRAPTPDITSIFDPSTPTISSSSDDTSPLKTPHSLRSGWHIGSTLSHSPYGWTGGDGKEIKFIGYGPHAERDPNSVVNFNFQGRTSSFGTATISNGFHEDKENFSTDYVAPKSQRQWAEKLGYHKISLWQCGDHACC